MVPLKIVSNVSRFKPALNLNRVLADLNRGSNSLNSISGLTFQSFQSTAAFEQWLKVFKSCFFFKLKQRNVGK